MIIILYFMCWIYILQYIHLFILYLIDNSLAYLKYNNDLLQSVQNLGLMYDSSTSSIREDTTWPYTLDNGVSEEFDCQNLGICGTLTPHNGIWEIPLYSTFYTGSKFQDTIHKLKCDE